MGGRGLRIAFVSTHDPADLRAFSGIAHFALAALRAHVGEVTVLRAPALPRWLPARLLCVARYLLRTAWALRPARFDLALVMQAPVLGALLPHRVPLVYTSDVTWKVYEGYYPPVYRRRWQLRLRRALERRAIRRADLLVYSSQWAADSAVQDYGVAPGRVVVIPYGANLAQEPAPPDVRARVGARVLRLLFLAVEWERKGGDVALEAVRALNEMGVPAHLTVCGCTPPPGTALPACVTLVPFIDKADPAQAARLRALLEGSHLLLLPTRAEALGIVFCEAAAYGLPVVSARTGGVESVVEEGVSGHLLAPGASGEEYARVVAGAWGDPEGYVRLCEGARRAYEARLSWRAWGEALRRALARRLAAPRPS